MGQNIKDFATYSRNPFLPETLPYIKEKKARTKLLENTNMKLLDESTGSMEPMYSVQITTKHVDTQEFTKIYAEFLGIMVDLKSTSQRVLLYLLNGIKQDCDVVEFNLKSCREASAFKSDQSVYIGLSELLEKKFIARTELHYKYFINPTMFFNGNRLRIVKEYITAPKFPALPKPNPETL